MSSDTLAKNFCSPHMDRDHFGQIWPSSGQKWPSTTLGASETLSLYWGNCKGVVHEKSVKSQRLQILLQIKSPTLIWIESLSSKDERPHFKNGRAQLYARRKPYHYIEKIEGGGPWKIGQNATSSNPFANQKSNSHMDRELKFQRWPSSLQKWPSTTLVATETLSLYRENLRGWSMKNRSKCNFFRSLWK